MSDIFTRLRHGPQEEARPQSSYSFQGGNASPAAPTFRDRPGVVSSAPATQPQVVNNYQQRQEPVRPPAMIRPERNADGDRPAAYEPPAVRRREDEGDMYQWKAPTFGDILMDLGLRMLEVGIGAAAYAVGEEIAYFFKKRRFGAGNNQRY